MALRIECTDCGRLVGTGAPARRVLSRPVAIWVLRQRPAIRGIMLQKTDTYCIKKPGRRSGSMGSSNRPIRASYAYE